MASARVGRKDNLGGKTKSKVVAPRNPRLIRDNEGLDKQTPSAFMAEMALTTDERLKQTHEMRIPQIIELLDMSETTHQKFTTLDIEMPLFQPFPSEIGFQNFEPFEIYTVPLHLRNNDKVARLVKVTQADSPYFKIISPPDVGHKVAPGMDTIFLIQFSPDEKKDYSHELICITEREKFLVPIKAIGARAILDFPDEVSFSSCPVKYSSTKTLLVRNVGNRNAKIQLLTESPFSASPDSCLLGIAESMQVDVIFNPLKTGDYESNMVISYDTGENIYVTLYGVANDVNVRLDKNTVKLDNTYITSASQRTVSICNRSDVIAHYEWKPLATLAEELQQKQRFYQELSYKEEEQKDTFIEECISDPSLRDKFSLVTRSFKNRIKAAEGEKMLYNDDIICIDPVEGDIWPNSHVDINIIFKPDESKSYARTVYCDVTGRESRLPLRIRGEGIGPKIQFSFDTLDIENVFVNSEHSYEVILKNVGDIDAVFSYIQSESLFGQQFDFSPTEGIVVPGGYQAIQINFTSPYLGEFVEEFYWMVEGSAQKFKFSIRGCVIGPTFHFDTPILKFNRVSFGFTHVAACKLVNTSLIPMDFSLRVPSDGKGASAAVIANSFLQDNHLVEDSLLHKTPKEFEIFPNCGTLDPQSEIEIQVHLTSLNEQKYETYMVVDVEGVGKEILSLPILASSVVPEITVETPILDYGRCFIRYPYEKMVVLKNETDLPAKYELLDQVPDDRSGIQYLSHYIKGIIQPQSLIEIPLQVSAHGMAKLLTSAFFIIHGSPDMPLQVQLTCIGEGPVVHVSSLDIDFGAIPVLEDVVRYVKLSNESLIAAEFFCDMVRPHSLFCVEPSSGIIPAEHTMTLAITASVDDCLKFQDKLKISITDGQLHTISLAAHGTGTTIVSEPPMAPIVHIGATFSSRPCTRKFRLINRGRRSQQMFWSTEGFPLVRSKKKQEYNLDDVKYQRMPPPPVTPRPVFKLKPDRMSLSPGQSQEVILEGYSDKPQQVKERMICHAIVGSNTGKERIMKVDIVAEFIEPLVQYSEKKVSFFVMKHPHTKLVKEIKEILFGNISKLPLKMSLDVEFPFQLLKEDCNGETSNMIINLGVNQSIPIVVQFDPEYQKDSFCRSASCDLEITYEDHPNKDIIELKGDVYYPNLTFETEVIDFGCVLNDTEHIKNVTVTNHSPLKVNFKWHFQENTINFEAKEDDEGLGREISDGEDETDSKEKLTTSQTIPPTYFTGSEERPKTSPAISHLPILMRPRTAPDSSDSAERNSPSLPWHPRSSLVANMSIQEVFDVLPLYGELEPGETQQFQFTYYGHSHSVAEAIAVCSVHGGPDYRVYLKGQASLMQYGFSCTHIDLGRQIYDNIVTTEIILFNRGKVTFDFCVMDIDQGFNPVPGGIIVQPAEGSIETQQSQTLTIRLIPGFPDVFTKQFRIRVGHFEPEVITVVGDGIFPRITFSLARDIDDPRYCTYLNMAKSVHETRTKSTNNLPAIESKETAMSLEDEIEEEIDRLQVKDYATELMNKSQNFAASFLNTASTKASKKNKPRPYLSDYVMDFGYVVYGTVVSQISRLTNTCSVPVSLTAEKRNLSVTGFSLELDKARDIPEGESIDFHVSFDPKSADLSLGPVETIVPVKITNGPCVGLKLKAVVTMPDLQLSTEYVDFDSVICGQCKVITVQMCNYTQVKCDWVAETLEEKKNKSFKKVPLHLRKKMKTEKLKPRTFEMMPPTGTLRPGQRLNVQVKFMPTEEMLYNQKLVLSISQSTYKHYLTCRGNGLEPKLEFSDTMLNFGPVLPHAVGDELNITVRNPALFPVEFYSLEFDRKYLEEEKTLRAMRGYDEYNTILLPPRNPGDELPKELFDAYNEMRQKKEETETKDLNKSHTDDLQPTETFGSNDDIHTEQVTPALTKKFDDSKSEEDIESEIEESESGVGELEITPISAAIARHLGIDLSAEGKAARNRRGIAIIVHGAPLSGKTATAAALAETYQAALLQVDDIVKEAIAIGTSSSANRARELSALAAKNATSGDEQQALAQGNSNEIVNSLSVAHPTGPLAGGPSTTGTLHAGFRESRKTTQPVMKQHKAAHVSPPSTPPLGPPPPRKLSITQTDGDSEFYSCVLPDDLLVEIVAEKLQSSDCQMGVVFDGLESIFASNITSCANALLRAINNRKYIFAVTLKLNKDKLKLIEEKKKEQAAKREKQEREAERIRLEEMSEDEYEALPEEERAAIDRKRLEAKKQRMKKKETEEQREREIREEKLLEEKRLEEERSKTKQKRAAASQGAARKGHEKDGKDKKHEKSNDRLTITREATAKDRQPEHATARITNSGNLSERSESLEDADRKRLTTSRAGKKEKERAPSFAGLVQIEENAKPSEEEIREKELSQRFQAFESSLRDVSTLLDAWDRTTGSVFISESEKSELDQEPIPVPVNKKGQASHRKVDKEKEKEKEKEKLKEIPSSPISAISVEHAENITEEDEATKVKPEIGIPNIILQTVEPRKSMREAAFKENILPVSNEVKDGLGLGPGGPPVPPCATFSVVPYPVRRKPPVLNEFGQHYVFVAAGSDDPNAAKDEKIVKTPDMEVEKTPDKKPEHRSRRAREKDEKDSVSIRTSRIDRMPSGTKKGRQSAIALAGQRSSSPPLASPSGLDDDKSTNESSMLASAAELIRHRWVVPAEGSLQLRIRFSSPDLGQYDQTLNFEIVGTRRRYQIFCRGICCFPTISREPRIVFPHRKKYRKPEDIVQKKYILSNETYEFGPLLAGKNRDRYREGKYPENMEQLCISNTSPMEAEMSFCFQTDTNGSTFLLEPGYMNLKANESQIVNIWAYPKTPGFFEDVIVACIKENPEPVLFKVSCHGVRPELEIDKRIIQFDRVLLYRKETRVVYLRNSTLLPIAWKLSGMENLGDDFSVAVDNGIIDPKTEFALQMHFRAIRPTNVKKIVRLEVSDAANIMGLTHAENIQVQAEAYDVALDMSFPKGADGGLDFGTLRVFDEAKQSCSLKNKGRYEISYSFVFESTDGSPSNISDLFTIVPNKGTLIPSDRPTQVQVMFKSKDEISIKEQPILKCQIVEPSLSDTGETIASIPVKISVRSVYSKYSIFPVQDINFGAILVNTRKTRTITIENKGEFDFRYSIVKMLNNSLPGKGKAGLPSKRSRDGSASGRSQQVVQVAGQSKQKRTDSMRGPDGSGIIGGNTGAGGAGSSSVRLQLGMFTIFPANGVVLPGSTAQVTVDMFSEASAVSEEDIAIDITERAPFDCPGGIEYKLLGETCLPSICTLQANSIPLIFEEHRIVSNLNVFRYHAQDLEPGSGVYGEEENKFVFYNVIVGHKAKARIKISNPNKVSCDVIFSVKPVSSKPSARWTDVYDVEPQRAAIHPHSFVYVTIAFQPPSMQSYSAVFEAAVDGLPSAIAKGRNLIFDIHGDGNLPRVSVIKPTVLTKRGNPLLLFSRLLTNRTQVLPLVLKNEGTLPCSVNMTLTDPDCCFTVNKETPNDAESPLSSPTSDDSWEAVLESTSSKPVMTSFTINVGVKMNFYVEFTPSERKRIAAEVRLSVVNNPFEDTIIQLLGEGFEEEVTIDNIHGDPYSMPLEDSEDLPAVPRNNHVIFGDCAVGVASHQSFTLTNHSDKETVRFNWDPPPQLKFSPCIGHLLPTCAKDVTVTFLSNEATNLEAVNVPCHFAKIQQGQNISRAGAWDDRQKVVRWIDAKSDVPTLRSEDDDRQARILGEQSSTPRPTKRKVVETEPEPAYTLIPGTSADLDLLFSAKADYAKFQLNVNKILFKDTLVFQTRMYSFTLKNTGDVQFDYAWFVQPGWTREPTDIPQEQTEEKPQTAPIVNQVQTIKSAKGSRDGSRSPRVSLPVAKAAADSRTAKLPVSRPDQSRGSNRQSDVRPPSRMASASDGRPATAMALAYDAGSVFSEPTGNDLVPFTIEPQYGTIKPKSTAMFTVKFSPLDVLQYGGTLIADIPNLEPNMECPVLLLHGRSLLPWCHFELEESDYISSRRNPELKGPCGSPPGSTLDPSTKVIEFVSCGIKTTTTRRFYIMNPTNTTYKFYWSNEDVLDPSKQFNGCQFTCLTPSGMIEAGKKLEIVFEYSPESMDVHESFWRFFIQDQNVSVSFLLVGMATDPAVSLDKSHLNFKELLIGHKSVQSLNIVNDEDKDFQFSFDKESCYAPGHVAYLEVEPMAGTCKAKSKLSVNVAFCPETEQEVNFNLICKVKRKTVPLTVNIKAEGFSVAAKLMCEDSQGNKVTLSKNGVNLINLGDVEVNEKVVRQLYIENLGKFNLDFSWDLKQSLKRKSQKDAWTKDDPPVSIVPESGTVQCNTRRRCQLSFCPPCKMSLKGCELFLKIVNGPKYQLAIAGNGVTPSLDFSFNSYDFGPCFLHRSGLPVPKVTLIMENKDTKDVSFECQYKTTPHLEVVSEPGILSPGEKSEAEFLFYPRELKAYHERVPFEINGLSMFYIDVTGQGTEMKVEVANPVDRKINLGALRIGKVVNRSVKIINNSLAALDFCVAITPGTLALQQSNVLSISPTSMISLKPKATTDISVNFAPKTRIPSFSEEVILECAGISQPLFVLSGSCHGMEIRLDSEAIPFGSVTLGSSSSRKLIMHNTGDIGAAFCWNIEKFKPDFTVSPVKGYIAAGMEVTFDIIFTPTVVSQDIRYDALRCVLEGGRPLKLVLTGSCIPQMPMKEIIHFQTHVRNRDVKNLTIHNKTNQVWLLKPTIDGEFWTGPDTISIEPQQGKNYEITYRPLTMTLENKKHTGTIFFALPDGSGLLYNLSGAADAPKPVGNIQRDVPCKVSYTEILQVSNWLRKPQRFRVSIEMLKPEKPDPATTLKGLEYSDVPGLSKKEYRLNFYAHKEGTFSAKVTFKNEQTGEYQFYYVQFKATTPGVISVIDLSTPVRQSIEGTITLNNPLQTPVNFQTNCNIQEISLPPQRTVPPQSEDLLRFEYLPIKSGETTARLSLQSSELGLYLYDLNLTATPANPERPVHFITTLGMNQTQTCRFVNYARSKVEYSCKVDNPEFLVDRSVTAASASSGGSEVGVDATFEPTTIGDCKGTLTITSNAGGEYTFPLYGHCLPPKPQGPYSIKAGGSTSIPFKNVFPQTTSFLFHVDNPSFTVKSNETIRGKKTHSINVAFEGNQGDSKAVRMGKLVVTCVRSAGTNSNLAWTFYLKGITP